jgi:hypothetical protein
MGTDDTLDLPGFDLFHNIRPKSKNALRHYGGISICIKHRIRKGVKTLPITNSEITWLKLSKQFFNFEQDRYLAVIYVSPPSVYSAGKENMFTILEDDIAKFSKLGRCFVYGDFNARTGLDPDYCLDGNSPIADIFPAYISDSALPRNNSDVHNVDNYGRQLLSLCKSSGMRILNGRTVGDSFGHCTCYSYSGHPSLIDYALASVDIIDDVQCLYVHEPCELSIHCMISCVINTGSSYVNLPTMSDGVNLSQNNYLNQSKCFSWDGDDERFHNALHGIISAQTDKFSSCQSIDSAVECLSNTMSNAAILAKIKQRRCKKKSQSANHKKTSSAPKSYYIPILMTIICS